MAELKAQANDASESGFLNEAVNQAERRADCDKLLAIQETKKGRPVPSAGTGRPIAD
jgi:hypothetical protein